jgi:phosphatidate cytidylyltransferase
MKRVLTALVLIPLVLLAVFRAPDWLFTLLVGVVAVLATIEYLQIAAKYGYRVYPVVTCLCVGIIFVAVAASMSPNYLEYVPHSMVPLAVLVFVLVLAPSVLLGASMRSVDLKHAFPGAAFSYFAIPYVGVSMLCLAVLRFLRGGWFFVLFTFFAVWMGDTAAYYVGRSIGKTKFAARVSPKKTWEGAIASVVAAVVVGVAFTWSPKSLESIDWSVGPALDFIRPPLWAPVLIALMINVAAQMGDLFESLIKRGAEVKDSGTMLPGHGGILDRIDALLFAAPVALVMFMIWGERFYKTM